MGHPVPHHYRADGDGGVQVAGKVEVADGAGVGAAPVALQLGDDLHGADLGRAGHRAGGEAGPQGVVGGQIGPQAADHVGDQVHHVGILLDRHELRRPHGARLGYAADIVAGEVHQHDMLSPLLLVAGQLLLHAPLVVGVTAAAAGAGDGMCLDEALLDPHQHLRRGADDVGVPHGQVVHVGRGVDGAQGPVDGEGMGMGGPLEALGDLHLVDVPGDDVVAAALHLAQEVLLLRVGDDGLLADRGRLDGIRDGGEGPGQPLHQLVNAPAGLPVGCLHIAVQAAVGDDLDGVLQVVEYQDGVGEHEQGLGEGLRVGLGDGDARLEVAGDLVRQEADSAAGEAGQAVLDGSQAEPRQLPLDLQEGVRALVGASVGAAAQDAVGLSADEAVAGQPLAPFDGLQEEGVVAAGHLEERRYGRLQVGGNIAVDGSQVGAGLSRQGADGLQVRVVGHRLTCTVVASRK